MERNVVTIRFETKFGVETEVTRLMRAREAKEFSERMVEHMRNHSILAQIGLVGPLLHGLT